MSNGFLCILLFFSLPFLILPIDNIDWDDMVKRENDKNEEPVIDESDFLEEEESENDSIEKEKSTKSSSDNASKDQNDESGSEMLWSIKKYLFISKMIWINNQWVFNEENMIPFK